MVSRVRGRVLGQLGGIGIDRSLPHHGVVAGPQPWAANDYDRAGHPRILKPTLNLRLFLSNRSRRPARQECVKSWTFGRFALSQAACRSHSHHEINYGIGRNRVGELLYRLSDAGEVFVNLLKAFRVVHIRRLSQL